MKHQFDTIVIGLGGMGGAIAYHLAKSGTKVLGLDRFTPPHDKGASHGATRIIRQAYFEDARYIPLLKRTYELWQEQETLSHRNLFHRVGLLIMSDDKGGVPEKVEKNSREYSIPVEKLTAAQLKSRFPQFQVPETFYGLWEPGAGYLDVEACVETHLQLAKQSGAVLHFNEPLLEWKSSGAGVSVKTSKATYEAEQLVLAPGPYSAELLPNFPMKFSSKRAMQFWFSGRDRHYEKNGMPCFAFSRGTDFIYGFPNQTDLGVKVAHHSATVSVTDPATESRDYRPEELATVARYLREFLPGIEPNPIRHKLCFYNLTTDTQFLLDWHPEYKNVYLATGGSGHAFKFTSVIGEIASNDLHHRPQPHDLTFLRLRADNR